MNIYYIGGSPCSGKSTVAEILSEQYDLYYFKVDDFLDSYTKQGALKGYPVCRKQVELTPDQIWMWDPVLQCREELIYYEEVFEFIRCVKTPASAGGEYNKFVSVAGANPPSDKRSAGMRRDSVRKMSAKADPNSAPRPVRRVLNVRDLEQIKNVNGVITEGAAYVPGLIRDAQIPENRYLSITPTKEFQLFHFRKRTFVPYILRGCSNMERAFDNWMERDILFAGEVRKQCGETGYTSVINDGSMEIAGLADLVATHFGLVSWKKLV